MQAKVRWKNATNWAAKLHSLLDSCGRINRQSYYCSGLSVCNCTHIL